jgi:hypothetical protein
VLRTSETLIVYHVTNHEFGMVWFFVISSLGDGNIVGFFLGLVLEFNGSRVWFMPEVNGTTI